MSKAEGLMVLRFVPSESTDSYLRILRAYLLRHGLPVCLVYTATGTAFFILVKTLRQEGINDFFKSGLAWSPTYPQEKSMKID